MKSKVGMVKRKPNDVYGPVKNKGTETRTTSKTRLYWRSGKDREGRGHDINCVSEMTSKNGLGVQWKNSMEGVRLILWVRQRYCGVRIKMVSNTTRKLNKQIYRERR